MGGPTFFEKPAITAPVYSPIQQALLQLQSVVLKERIYKNIDRPESDRVWNYPYRALEESIANAMYHRYFFWMKGINEGANEGVNSPDNHIDIIKRLICEGVNEGVSENIYDIIQILLNVSGLNTIEITTRIRK